MTQTGEWQLIFTSVMFVVSSNFPGTTGAKMVQKCKPRRLYLGRIWGFIDTVLLQVQSENNNTLAVLIVSRCDVTSVKMSSKCFSTTLTFINWLIYTHCTKLLIKTHLFFVIYFSFYHKAVSFESWHPRSWQLCVFFGVMFPRAT